MPNPKISIIVAMAEDRAIGKDGKLLWHIPQDLKHFKNLTLNHPIICGRKTFEAIGRPLPKRTNIIVTRDPLHEASGCLICHSLAEAIEKAREIDQQEIFIIGGGEIYIQGIDLADKLYLTIVQGKFKADTYFPGYTAFEKIIKESEFIKEGVYTFKFLELERK